ncbi:MAG: PTS sugar transporter subunit IIA [Candidatus Binatia bacterium]
MVGIVVMTHGRLGEEMVRTVESVIGRVAGIEAVSVDTDLEVVKAKLRRVIERSDEGGGTLVLTDMLGDTATNLALAVAGSLRVEVIAGANMPMLLKAASARGTMGLREFAAFIRQYGRDHIFWASEHGGSTDGTVRG